ncbi:hypothetical protein [Chitinophaga cymbidii]|uniref:hypothetical protein n=1 Tax=Chitinophaga cymbidii TaxID=1096750 RepID=UPI0011BE807D|nr:hypothetical protein [Chitinophaga cymbidii]
MEKLGEILSVKSITSVAQATGFSKLEQTLPSHLQQLFTSILVMDSTEFKLPESLSETFCGFQGDGTASCAQGGSKKHKPCTVSEKRYSGWSEDTTTALNSLTP